MSIPNLSASTTHFEPIALIQISRAMSHDEPSSSQGTPVALKSEGLIYRIKLIVNFVYPPLYMVQGSGVVVGFGGVVDFATKESTNDHYRYRPSNTHCIDL